jgi:hypothetical protein
MGVDIAVAVGTAVGVTEAVHAASNTMALNRWTVLDIGYNLSLIVETMCGHGSDGISLLAPVVKTEHYPAWLFVGATQRGAGGTSVTV